MKKLSVFGIIGGAALLAAAPFSLQWSQGTVTLSVDSADARVGRPLTALSVAGVQRRSYRRAVRSTVYAGAAAGAVGYGVGAYYGGYGYPAYTALSSPSYGTGYGYGSYYGSSYPSSGYAGSVILLRLYRLRLSCFWLYRLRLSFFWLCRLQLSFLWLRQHLPPGRSRRPQGGDPSRPLALRLELKKSYPRGGAAAPQLRNQPRGSNGPREKKNDQVDRTRRLCLGFRNFGASNDARAHPSAGRHDHPSRRRLRSGQDPS